MTRSRAEIFVKVAQTGGLVHEVCLNGGRSVEDALEASGISYSEDDKIKVNGETAELGDELEAGDVVTTAGNIEGGLN